MNQIPLDDDISFWSRQMTEHALFLNLLIQEPTLKNQALQLYHLWNQTVQQGGDISMPLAELIAFKKVIIQRLQNGEWLGWALPSFVEHILMEAQYFQERLGNGTDAMTDVNTWLQVVKDHADVGPKLIDPQANDFADTAKPASQALANLQRQCSRSVHRQCLHDADEVIQQVNDWVNQVPAGFNIIHPALSAHILRENNRGLQVTRMLQQS